MLVFIFNHEYCFSVAPEMYGLKGELPGQKNYNFQEGFPDAVCEKTDADRQLITQLGKLSKTCYGGQFCWETLDTGFHVDITLTRTTHLNILQMPTWKPHSLPVVAFCSKTVSPSFLPKLQNTTQVLTCPLNSPGSNLIKYEGCGSQRIQCQFPITRWPCPCTPEVRAVLAEQRGCHIRAGRYFTYLCQLNNCEFIFF